MTDEQNYALTFQENKVVFTGEPANPPMPDLFMTCYAGKFYKLPFEQVWYECLVSGSYTEIDDVNFSEVTI